MKSKTIDFLGQHVQVGLGTELVERLTGHLGMIPFTGHRLLNGCCYRILVKGCESEAAAIGNQLGDATDVRTGDRGAGTQRLYHTQRIVT